jgi:hypothetical protein
MNRLSGSIKVMLTLTVLFDLRNRFDLERGLGDDPEAALGPQDHLVDVGPDGDTRSLQYKLLILVIALYYAWGSFLCTCELYYVPFRFL